MENELKQDKPFMTYEQLIQKLLNDTKRIQQVQLYKYMGFPENWIEIKNKSNKDDSLKLGKDSL